MTYKRYGFLVTGIQIMAIASVLMSLLVFSGTDGVHPFHHITFTVVIVAIFFTLNYKKTIAIFDTAVERHISELEANQSTNTYIFSEDHFGSGDYQKKTEYKWFYFKAYGYYQEFIVLIPKAASSYFLINKNDFVSEDFEKLDAFLKTKLPLEKIKSL